MISDPFGDIHPYPKKNSDPFMCCLHGGTWCNTAFEILKPSKCRKILFVHCSEKK
jgi:hypothetical protein